MLVVLALNVTSASVKDSAVTARAERPARVKLAKQIIALLPPGRSPQKGACKAGSGDVSLGMSEVIENVI